MLALTSKLNLTLVYIFLSHGILYYLFPDQHYNPSGWLVLIKYTLIIPIFFLSIFSKNPFKSEVYLFLLFLLTYIPGIAIHPEQEKIILSIQYMIPLLSILMTRGIVLTITPGSVAKISFSLAIICLFSSAYDLIFGGLNDRFSYSGARASSIWVNPNNSAITVALIGLAGITNSASSWKKSTIASISLLSLVLLGSKTGFLIFLIFTVFFHRKYFYGIAAFFLSISFIFFDQIKNYWDDLGLRSVDGDSGNQRIHDWLKFGEMIDDASAVNLFFGQYKPGYAIDNCYLDMSYHLGIIAPTATIIIQMISIYRSYFLSRFVFFVNITFLLAMLTTNILRLWPLGYIFWVAIAYSISTPKKDGQPINSSCHP